MPSQPSPVSTSRPPVVISYVDAVEPSHPGGRHRAVAMPDTAIGAGLGKVVSVGPPRPTGLAGRELHRCAGLGVCAARPQRRRQPRRSTSCPPWWRPTAGWQGSPVRCSVSRPRSAQVSGDRACPRPLDEFLTGRENLTLFGQLRGLRHRSARRGPMNSSGGSTWAHAADRRVSTYPAACEGVSTSRSRWSCPPRVLFSTSRRPAWTRAAAAMSGSGVCAA